MAAQDRPERANFVVDRLVRRFLLAALLLIARNVVIGDVGEQQLAEVWLEVLDVRRLDGVRLVRPGRLLQREPVGCRDGEQDRSVLVAAYPISRFLSTS